MRLIQVSSYQLKNISTRANGPDVDATYHLGYFREDYEYIVSTGEDHLDEHNGRLCVTPEYPDGTYAYFATVDENWNSTYPYVVGPTFYGVSENRKVNIISEITTVYNGTSGLSETRFGNLNISIFPNPATDLIAIQVAGLVNEKLEVELFDISGKLVSSSQIREGSTIAYFDLQTIYEGIYLVKISNEKLSISEKVVIMRE